MMNNLIVLIFCSLFLCAACLTDAPGRENRQQRTDYQKMADETKWNRDAERASVG